MQLQSQKYVRSKSCTRFTPGGCYSKALRYTKKTAETEINAVFIVMFYPHLHAGLNRSFNYYLANDHNFKVYFDAKLESKPAIMRYLKVKIEELVFKASQRLKNI